MGIEALGTAMPALGAMSPTLDMLGVVRRAGGAFSASAGTKAAYQAQADVDRNNAVLTDAQAADALARGDRNAEVSGIRTRQLLGTQRAALGANGVDLGVGSAQHIQSDTINYGDRDTQTVMNNASREAWGYNMQGANFRMDALAQSSRAATENPWMAAGDSLLTGAGTVAKRWYEANKPTGAAPNHPGDGLGQGDRRKIGVG